MRHLHGIHESFETALSSNPSASMPLFFVHPLQLFSEFPFGMQRTDPPPLALAG